MALIRHFPPGAVDTSSGLVRGVPGGGFEDVAAGGGATTGTGALTTEPTTLSGAGTLNHKGTGSLSTQPVTLSGAGKLTHTGTGALATYPTLLSATGKLAHIATGSLTIAPITLSGSGDVTGATVTLSAATVIDITTTTATPRVTLDFA
jgi:hypothetical protein